MNLTARRILRRFVIGLSIALASVFAAGTAWADPPARIARLSYFSGTVSFSPAGDEQWANAVLNRPVISGDRLWSDNGGRVELTLDNSALWLGTATSVVVSNIDDRITQFELQQGTLDLRVRRILPGGVVEIDTPNLAFQATQAGRYRIEVDLQSGSTTVIVRNGTAEVYGERASYVVASGQGYRFYGSDLRDNEFFTPRGVDEFDRFAFERDSRFDRVVSVQYVSSDVVGYEDFDRYGSWYPVESYGNVWFPQNVPSDWAPYHYGHWSWIDPWGWTWVDDAPWGFAPCHYGRWVYVQQRWGWVPGPIDVRPVYAPALVAFVGGTNFSISVSSGPSIGWFPLGPREVYVPAYNVSREYYRQVNVSNTVINNTVINNTYVSNVTSATVAQQVNYVNMRAPNAVTAVPPVAFAQSQPVNRAAVRLPSAALNTAQVQPIAPVAPTRTAFIGGSPLARAKPPATMQQQTVVAKSPPPPAPLTVTQRLQALEKNPGKPLDRADIPAATTAESVALPTRNIKIVNARKPTTSTPPPAVQGDAFRARTAPPSVAPAPAAPTPPQTGTVAAPTNVPTTHGPPAASTPPSAVEARRLDRPTDAGGIPAGQPPRSTEAARQGATTPSTPGVIVPQSTTRAVPQEQARPVPPVLQAQPPLPGPPEHRPVQQEERVARPLEQRVVPQDQPRPTAQQQAPVMRAPELRSVPQEQLGAATKAQPPAPSPPELRAVTTVQRPVPQAQPHPATQSAPSAPPKPDNRQDDKKEKDNAKERRD
jgi:hypothetical protein